VHDHVNVHVDVHVIVDVDGFSSRGGKRASAPPFCPNFSHVVKPRILEQRQTADHEHVHDHVNVHVDVYVIVDVVGFSVTNQPTQPRRREDVSTKHPYSDLLFSACFRL
jgi:hypothetical protein